MIPEAQICERLWFHFLFILGSLIYRLDPTTPKFMTKLFHAAIHFLVCIGMTFGLVAIIKHHNVLQDPHFRSLHSWIGIGTISCYFAQVLWLSWTN